ncbi:hypothetical protein D7Y42_15390 [Stenotrophomonas maltophilia]|nr:hypothetical protein [Stenotrophomonas maltophilia]MBA0376952.1 hypothetical protein [Stenotrophomonas maltophilia]MBA0547544.1 hypothetical protein [Stenotrophomonas maltophilia]OWQ69109.1 hypothetical protein CEE57_14040 [Stenotrophomonas maltophilia]PWI00405.1 hypothetical protein DI494_21500 [Stenotrophomonas maltophilia]
MEKEVQHYTSNLTIREKVDFTSVAGPIQLAVRRVGRGRQRPETRLPVHGLKPGSSPMVEAAAATRQV